MTTVSPSATTPAPTGTTALGSLSSNFNSFLTMLMTQLKNQDPTSPMDTNQFTSELVQFSSVEQQINTNTSLTKLIELTQAGEITQSSAMLGKQVTVSADHIPLQNGKGTVGFTASSAQPVAISISTEAGVKLRDVAIAAAKGDNTWTWDGKDGNGKQLPDGSYRIAVNAGSATEKDKTVAVPFTVSGTVTGVVSEAGAVQLKFGAQAVPFSAVKSVGGPT